jgi:hypothetical protein
MVLWPGPLHNVPLKQNHGSKNTELDKLHASMVESYQHDVDMIVKKYTTDVDISPETTESCF